VAVDMGTWDLLVGGEWQDRPPRLLTDRWRHDRKNPLAGGGFRGQGRAIGHRGDHGAVRHQEGQQGSKIAGQKVGREGQPHLAPPITSSPTQLGSLVVGEGWWASWLWPRSASRFFWNRKPLLERDRAGQKGSQTSSERECPENSSVCEKRSLSGFASGRATYGRSRRLCDGPSTVTFLGSTRSV
jgi:hypothetical protein